MMENVKSFILWYNSASHGRTRYFVGTTKKPCKEHGFHPTPAWTYEKDAATILDGEAGPKAKKFAELCGYKALTLEPIDELPTTQSTLSATQ